MKPPGMATDLLTVIHMPNQPGMLVRHLATKQTHPQLSVELCSTAVVFSARAPATPLWGCEMAVTARDWQAFQGSHMNGIWKKCRRWLIYGSGSLMPKSPLTECASSLCANLHYCRSPSHPAPSQNAYQIIKNDTLLS